jgi:regulatory protein
MAKAYISRDVALQRLQRFCAFQDRCHLEVRRKLLDLGIYGTDLEEIICQLVEENFLNEERFARSFARGKFQIKSWGRIRIIQELKARQISAYCQRKALEEIEPVDYKRKLIQLLQIKMQTSVITDIDFAEKQALFQFALRKGYETELIREVLQDLISEK